MFSVNGCTMVVQSFQEEITMKRHLNISMEEESIVKLQKLAGGERKVGEYVTGLANWIWEQKAVLARVPLEKLELRDDYASDEVEMLNKRFTDIERMLAALGLQIEVSEKGATMLALRDTT